jgi:nucleoside 2-deoxyribosyltransferase-like protein
MALYYVAHRPFSAHDRALAAYTAHRLAQRVGADKVFLPFCDTNEDDLTHPCKGRRLFELDHERLRHIDAMLALLHGPSLDDGVCMEIGYAAALGVPVVALTTDFQTYGTSSSGPARTFPDPLLDVVLAEVIRVPQLGPPPAQAADRFMAFLRRNLQPIHDATDQAISALLRAQRLATGRRAAPAVAGRCAFIEDSPYLPRDLWRDTIRLLESRGWQAQLATRLRDPPEPSHAAHADWTTARRAGMTLIDTLGPETPPGAALIAGACAATGRTVLAADPGRCWTFADGREPNWRNLMIQYAVSGRFTNTAELTRLIGPP